MRWRRGSMKTALKHPLWLLALSFALGCALAACTAEIPPETTRQESAITTCTPGDEICGWVGGPSTNDCIARCNASLRSSNQR